MLTNNEVEKLQGMISQCKSNLKNFLQEREQTIKEFKSNILLNWKEIIKYGGSQHLTECTKIFQQLKQNGESEFISMYHATDLRNYLMAVLALVNCLRASNLMYITLQYVDNATKDKTLGEAYLIKNKKYKVSTIYRAKVLLLSKDITSCSFTLNISDQSLSRMKIVPKKNVMFLFAAVLIKKHHHPNQTQ